MICSFCKKGSSLLVTHHLCSCCLGNLQCCTERTNAVVPSHEDVKTEAKIECDICLEEYLEDELEQHRDSCKAQVVFQCAICEQDYLSKDSLWNHLDIHEISDDMKELNYGKKRAKHILHKCVLCNDQRGYPESCYWKHIHEEHDGFFLQCAECGEYFRSQKQKSNHNCNHCQSREQAVPSDFESFKNVQGFSETNENNALEHFKHSDTISVSSLDLKSEIHDILDTHSNESLDVDNLENAEERLFVPIPNESVNSNCTICSKDFNNPISLKRHYDVCHRICTCNICGINIVGYNQYRYHKLKRHSVPLYKCPHCKMRFHLLTSYRKHLIIHQKEKKYACDLCDRTFKTLSYVRSHKERVHRKRKTSTVIPQCPICTEHCSDSQQLLQHVEALHQVTICTICGITFADPAQLKAHQTNEHTQIYQQSALKARKKHASSSSSSVTKCSECSKECFSAKTLQRHIDSCHLLITCNVCGIVNAGRHNARYHKLINHTEPSLQCPHCPKRFHIKVVLRRHLNQHSKNRKINTNRRQRCIVCGLCKQSFADASQLRHHQSIEHSVPGISTSSSSLSSQPTSRTRCTECNKECFKAKTLMRHIDSCHAPMECKICGITSFGRHKAQYHKMINHTEPQWKCTQCPKKFHQKPTFLRHIAQHTENMGSDNLEKYNDENSTESAPFGKITVPEKTLLEYPYPDKDSLVEQEPNASSNTTVSHTQFDFSANNQVTDHTDYNEIEAINELLIKVETPSEMPNEEENDMGEKLTETPSTANSERQKHRKPATNGVTCPHCNKDFRKAYLSTHIGYSHTLVTCEICSASIAGKSQLKYHMLTIHSEPQFECAHCSKKFHVKSTLRRHEEGHSKGNMIHCQICKKVLKTMYCLKMHMLQKHNAQVLLGETEEDDINVDPLSLPSEHSADTSPEDSIVEIKKEILEDEITP